MVTTSFWKDKRVLVTGHTGFKGSWLSLWLTERGANVSGLSLAPATSPSLHHLLGRDRAGDDGILDIRDRLAVAARVMAVRPEIVFHLAAQPLVRAAYRDPAATYDINVQGTANLLDILRISPDIRSIVVVTTDKVYENAETGRAFIETDPLGGYDPYSASKAAAEIVTSSYRSSFFLGRKVGLATARAGNVIGGGDWAEDRLIPDAVRAWSRGGSLDVRRPGAVRPWQHVLEPLHGYITLAERLWSNPELDRHFNFGPDHAAAATVGTVLEAAHAAYGTGDMVLGDGTEGPHEAGYLMLDSSLAAKTLGFVPRWDLGETVRRTMEWYRRYEDGSAAEALCLADIAAYEGAVRQPLKVAV